MSLQTLTCTACARSNRAEARFCGGCGRPLRASGPAAHDAPRAPFSGEALIGPDGRYRLHELIGRGGFGEAYLAEDLYLGRPCLVKRLVVRPDADPALARAISLSFAQEARSLVELNYPGHQNIPEIYEYLPAEQCLVMKYIAGDSLDRVLQRRSGPLPEMEALRLARDTCAALAYMHSHVAGPIIHRDLKPANIMLDSTGRVWLIDFGLARSAPPTVKGGAAQLSDGSGTYGYMPPEQLAGRPVPRSDVYALGVTLYELATNRRPARPGESLAPVRQINPELRPELELLLLRCLALTPEERPEAADLLAALDELLASANIAPPPEPNHPPDLPLLLGRDDELRLSGLVALVGMPGVGKTALATALARRYPRPDAVFWHRFYLGEGGDLLLARLAGWLAYRGFPGIWRQIQRSLQAGHPMVPELQIDYLAQSPAFAGCLLCLDDLHAVADDSAVITLLERLRQAGPERPAILITARQALPLTEPATLVRLAGLRPLDVRQLLVLRGLQLTESMHAQLYQITEGNPQFLALAVAALNRVDEPGQLLRKLLETDQVEQYLLRQVDERLSEREREVMVAVAVLLGRGDTRESLEAILDGAGIRRQLATLTDRQLLTTSHGEDGIRYQTHAMVQAFYYDLAGPRERRQLHQRAATYYAQTPAEPVTAARHYIHAGEDARAAALLVARPWELFNQGQAVAAADLAASLRVDSLSSEVRAELLTLQGEAAMLRGQEAEALRCLSQALNLAAEGSAVRQARRYRLLATLHEHRGEHAAAEDACRKGLALADAPDSAPVRSESARLYAQLAESLMRRDEHEAARDACRAGLAALPEEPAAPGERAALLQRLATIEGIGGAYGAAIVLLERSLNVARQAGDVALTARVLHNLGHFCYYSGRLNEGVLYLQESITLKESLGDRASVVDSLNTLGLVHLARNERVAAMEYLARGRDLAEQFKLRASLAATLNNVGQLHFELGEAAAAAASWSRASTIFGELGEFGEQANSLYLLGDAALAQGEPILARRYGEQALDLARRSVRPPLEACALRVVGEAHLALGEHAAAAAALAQAWDLAAVIGDPYDQALLLGARARLALAAGDRPSALALARLALAGADEQHIEHLTLAMKALLMLEEP